MNKFALIVFSFVFSTSVFGQVKISKLVKESEISGSNENALYFIDFWATWCKPCVPASQYLETLQNQYPNNFYVMSLSQESPEVVSKFLEKHDLKLAVAIDYDGETFKEHNVYSLPHGVLFNANGDKLWEGHPSDFKLYHLRNNLSKNKATINKSSFFITESYALAVEDESYDASDDFEFAIIDAFEDDTTIEIIETKDYLKINGNLQQILAYVFKVYHKQIVIEDQFNKTYSLSFNKGSRALNNIKRTIFKALKLSNKVKQSSGEVLVMNTEKASFWDTKQINWEGNNQNYLIGDSDLQADNISFDNVVYKLANLIEQPIVLVSKNQDTALHDWQIHYKYYELMLNNLQDYGIDISKQKAQYNVYNITKKAP
ncbi:TlpA family protein disulfide reductase [Neotamlana laminarinivorans]|uniref:TlpA family protein disulfide reductase n=1 Tax=Neotamlana laminarinivorans TaxID=2883124 RepID=A0A9X1L2Q5_9FLAO|nr:TlpA disulfide reductase family protein [Tamlana laminarinivorans]MCB4797849.1 TlpA family protein disulfide reductase [Tamlana laminarinivorans]